MRTFVVDASIVVKWVVPEPGSGEALSLLRAGRLVAPDLLISECANILWKKVSRRQVSVEEAKIATRLLEQSAVELLPMRGLIRSAVDLAVRISHPAHDCFYVSLAVANGWTFVTADESLVRKLRQRPDTLLEPAVRTLSEVASGS